MMIYSIKAVLLPPGCNLLMALVAWLLWKKSRRVARSLLVISAGSLFALSVPSIASHLMRGLQSDTPLTVESIKQFQQETYQKNTALVVLGGGRRARAPEFNDMDSLSARSLERVHYAATLAKQTGLPLLVSGGSKPGETTAEAILMNQVLTDDYGVTVRWLEPDSKNTMENAQNSAIILREQNIERVILITHGWHMERAMQAFNSQGLTVLAAPMGLLANDAGSQQELNFLPSSKALNMSTMVLHEYLAQLWYWLTS